MPPSGEGVLPPEMRMEGGEGMYMDAAPHLIISFGLPCFRGYSLPRDHIVRLYLTYRQYKRE